MNREIVGINDKMLLIKYPISAEKLEISIIFAIILINSNEIKFRFLSITIFIIDDVVDIKRYPTMSEKVPIYFGKK